jgi:exodeoxyribonuclease-1
MSVVFYDTETTGTLHEFDQILQFAAIRADAELRELDRFDIRCRLLPHVVPAPGALCVNQVPLSRLTDPSLPSHYEMIRAVRAKLISWDSAMFLGWNSIRFDEELVRQAFYQTLHNPYFTNTNGNCRSDIMRMAQTCTLYAPEAIGFARDASGQLVFRLEDVAGANGFASGLAHDAVHDAEAAIYLARLIMENAPRVWSSFMRFSKKAAVVAFTDEESVFCLHNFFAGQLLSCFATKIGQNSNNKAELFVYDLECDPQRLASAAEDELRARLGVHPKPIRVLKSNAAPILFNVDDALDAGINPPCALEELDRRARFIRDDSDLRARLLSAFDSQKPTYPPSPHVERQIYNGFPGESDSDLMESFHSVVWEKRGAIVEQFQDARLRTLGQRLIHVERPSLLSKTACQEHNQAIARRLLGQDGDELWMTLPKAIQELATMMKNSPIAEWNFLSEHHGHLCRMQATLQNITLQRGA